MDAFVSRKRRKISTNGEETSSLPAPEEQSTEEKLAVLASVFEGRSQEDLLETLLNHDGAVEAALTALLEAPSTLSPRGKSSTVTGIQSSLNFSAKSPATGNTSVGLPARSLTKKGRTLYLYSPASIAQHTPCSIIHNFLPSGLATALLNELLPETESYTSATFRLFDNIVQSPHTASFYVNSLAEVSAQKSTYLYNGANLSDVREILPVMRQVSCLVQEAVNAEISKRIATLYPNGQKLKHQPPGPWIPNAAFVNCYDGGQQSVGYHTDHLTYLGPHPVIGSLSLGVQREFRIRRIVPAPDLSDLDPHSAEAKKLLDAHADAQGQISLPLPHNSLLVMHAEMQEQWKHSIAPAGVQTGGIVPHPIAGNKRLNITYRWYRDEFAPKYIPKCRCGVPTVLKSMMRREETKGRYVWMCQTPGRVVDETKQADGESVRAETDGQKKEGKGCGYFEWAEFDDDGVPMWLSKQREKEKECQQSAQ